MSEENPAVLPAIIGLTCVSGLFSIVSMVRKMRKKYKQMMSFWSMRVTTLQGARSAFMSPVPPDFRELGFVMSMLGRKQGGPALEFVDLSKDFKDLQEYRMAMPQSYFLKYGGRPTSSPMAMMQSPTGLGQVAAMVMMPLSEDDTAMTIQVSATSMMSASAPVPQGITITKQYGAVTVSDGWVLAQGAGSHITTLTNPEGQEVASLAARPKVGWAFRVQRSLPELEQLKVLTMLAVSHPWTPIKIFRQQPPPPTVVTATVVAPPAGSVQPTVVGAQGPGAPVVVAAATVGVAGGAAGATYVYPGFEEYGQPGWTGGRGTYSSHTDHYNSGAGSGYAGGGDDTEANAGGDFGWDDPGDFDAGGDGFGGWDAGGGGGDGGFGEGGFGDGDGGGDGGFGGDGGGDGGGGDGGGGGGGDGGGGG